MHLINTYNGPNITPQDDLVAFLFQKQMIDNIVVQYSSSYEFNESIFKEKGCCWVLNDTPASLISSNFGMYIAG